jgi:CRISPR-associated protein Csb2
MLAIEIEFPAGRYHATPWDRQVNEGVVEWPPSPWRILRAIISTWYHKAQCEVDEPTIRDLVEKLSSLPSFYLPGAALGHTRHFMPLFNNKTTKVFDAFAALEENKRIIVMWHEIDLSVSEETALEILLSRIGYLGRAESWIEARLVHDQNEKDNSYPLKAGEAMPDGCEGVRTLACLPPENYLEWRTKILADHKERRLAELRSSKEKDKPEDKGGLGKKDLDKIEQNLPLDLFQALHADTGDLKSNGWSQPPGSIWVTYSRPRGAFDVKPSAMTGRIGKSDDLPTVARFVLASQVPPRLTDALLLAERIHLALVRRSDGSSVFSGCDESRRPLMGHRHAHVFCESNLGLGKGRRGEITHVTIYAPMGFNLQERKVLDGFTEVWGHGGHDIQLILLSIGQPEDFGGLDASRGECAILAKSRTWISRTPFMPTRHPKAKGGVPKVDATGLQIRSPEHELRRLLKLAGFSVPVTVELAFSTDLAGHETRWLSFKRERKVGEGRRAASGIGYGFRIKFSEPVAGPIALGYGAHFGLGLFVPESH